MAMANSDGQMAASTRVVPCANQKLRLVKCVKHVLKNLKKMQENLTNLAEPCNICDICDTCRVCLTKVSCFASESAVGPYRRCDHQISQFWVTYGDFFCDLFPGYVNDSKEGHGTFSWPDGRSYQGQWSEGKQSLDSNYVLVCLFMSLHALVA